MRKLSVATDFEEKGTNASLQRKLIRMLLGLVTVVFMLSDIFAGTVGAADYYISPNGFDSNDRGTSSSPWKTFSFAIPKLQPGDTLFLKNGTYTTSNSGFPDINCATNAKNGTDSRRITIKAENERQAFLSGDGSTDIFQMSNCSYWTIEGLRVESADFNGTSYGGTVYVGNSSSITLRRLLVAHNNRYKNSHMVEVQYTTNSLFEENELYYFHRHGFLAYHSTSNVFRRNYVNSRGYGDIPGGFPSGSAPDRGDAAISMYPASYNITENNVSEGNLAAINIEASDTSINNKSFGDISINDWYGAIFKARGQSANLMPQNTFVTNFVAIKARYAGVFFRGNKNSRCDNCSFLGGGGGLLADVEAGHEGDGIYSVYSTNSLAMNISGYGFQIVGYTSSSIDYTYSFNNSVNYGGGFSSTNSISTDPRLGTCNVFIPANSGAKGAGKNGADIGANVLYRYQNGDPTSQPLWDPKTGEFPHGAIIAGVNDLSGSSAFDVHKRLNVNTNGCSLPSSTMAATPSAPRNLQALSR